MFLIEIKKMLRYNIQICKIILYFINRVLNEIAYWLQLYACSFGG